MKIAKRLLEIGNLLSLLAIITALIAAVIIYLEASGTIKLGYCLTTDVTCIIFENIVYILIWSAITAISLFVLVIISEWAIFLILSMSQKIYSIIINLSKDSYSKNLKIYPWELQDNIFTLKLFNIELRHFQKRTTALGFIDFLDGKFNFEGSRERIQWRKQEAFLLELKRFSCYDVNFLEIDPEKNEFWIKTRKNVMFRFSPAKYGFEIEFRLNIYPVDNRNPISVIQPVHLIVDYDGGKNISVKLASRKEYEEYIWNRESVKEKRRTILTP